MKSNNIAWLAPALAVIESTDPALYAEMSATDWTLSAMDPAEDASMQPLVDKAGVGLLSALTAEGVMESLAGGSFGVTLTRNTDPIFLYTPPDVLSDVINPDEQVAFDSTTWLNIPAIEEMAGRMEVPVSHFAADVIVHEFAHITDGTSNEQPGYDAGTAFARKLGSEPIARLSQFSAVQNGVNP